MNVRQKCIGVLAFAVFLSLLLSPLLAAPAHGQSSNVISVTVRDSWMSPLANSTVYLDGAVQGLTDRHGVFMITGYTPGQHNITAAMSGYVNNSVEKDFNGADAIDIKLSDKKSTTATTIVVEDDRVSRSKISGATIYIDSKFAGLTTNGTGLFVTELPAGLHTFKISKDNLDTNTTQINVVPGSTYEILMAGGGRHLSILDGQLFLNSISLEIVYGLVNTLKLSIVAFTVGILIGLLMGIGRTSSNRIFRYAASIYVEGVRGIPLLLQLLFVFFGLPFMIGDLTGTTLNIDAFTASIIALSVNSGAYMAEIFKAGIQAVNKGQVEAARSLGMSSNQSLQYVILPQAFKIVLPPLGNEFIALIKDSSISLVIAVTEVTMEAKLIGVASYNTFTPLLAAGLIYLCITIPLGKLVQYMEYRFNTSSQRTDTTKKRKVPELPEEII